MLLDFCIGTMYSHINTVVSSRSFLVGDSKFLKQGAGGRLFPGCTHSNSNACDDEERDEDQGYRCHQEVTVAILGYFFRRNNFRKTSAISWKSHKLSS